MHVIWTGNAVMTRHWSVVVCQCCRHVITWQCWHNLWKFSWCVNAENADISMQSPSTYLERATQFFYGNFDVGGGVQSWRNLSAENVKKMIVILQYWNIIHAMYRQYLNLLIKKNREMIGWNLLMGFIFISIREYQRLRHVVQWCDTLNRCWRSNFKFQISSCEIDSWLIWIVQPWNDHRYKMWVISNLWMTMHDI